MWEERTSIRRREITNFSLHLFCLFWHNFGKKPSSVKEILSIIQFSIPQNYFSLINF